MNNLPKDYIRTCLTRRSLAELLNFSALVEFQEYIYSINISEPIFYQPLGWGEQEILTTPSEPQPVFIHNENLYFITCS